MPTSAQRRAAGSFTARCWREYADYEFGALHNLAVDTYAVQHPHNADRRNRQSVGVHLISLCALLEHDLASDRARTLIGDIAVAQRQRGGEWPHLVPRSLGHLTVADVHAAPGPTAHRELIRLWADSVWHAFSEYHHTVRGWLDAAWSDARR